MVPIHLVFGLAFPSSGYGRHENWRFRAAMTHDGGRAPKEMIININDKNKQYIKNLIIMILEGH